MQIALPCGGIRKTATLSHVGDKYTVTYYYDLDLESMNDIRFTITGITNLGVGLSVGVNH